MFFNNSDKELEEARQYWENHARLQAYWAKLRKEKAEEEKKEKSKKGEK